jgi:uncharacterized protein
VPKIAARKRSAIADRRLDSSSDRLQQLIEHAAHVLPSQGPLSVFVHHNTIHAFEEMRFDEAVEHAAHVYGCQPYLSEDRYRQELARGRIRQEDLDAVLQDDLGDRADELVGLLGTRYHLRLAMLRHSLRSAPSAELRWVVAETDALRTFRHDMPEEHRQRMTEMTRRWIMRDFRNGRAHAPASSHPPQLQTTVAELLDSFGVENIEQWSDADWESFSLQLLWRACYVGVQSAHREAKPPAPPERHRDVLLAATGHDSDELVNDVLIRYCSAFLDQGFAHWPLPDRDAGLYRSFLEVYGQPGGMLPIWLKGLRDEVSRLRQDDVSPLDSIEESLELLGVDDQHREHFITPTLLALRGWAGMIWQMETNAEWTVRPAPRGTLVDFLAVRLLLDRFATSHLAKEHLGFSGSLQDVRQAALDRPSHRMPTGNTQRAFLFFQLTQVMGVLPEELFSLPPMTWGRLADEIDAFSETQRRRTFHLAYERRYRHQTLDALAVHTRGRVPAAAGAHDKTPSFQIVCCIDDREESFRRHLEEVDPRCETLAIAGFYGVAMYYRGAGDAHPRPLCPVVIKPNHYVEEHPVYTFEELHRRRARARRWLGSASHHFHRGSRSLVGGAVTALVGSLASAPLVARILFPRTAAKIRQLFGQIVRPPAVTQLLLERSQPAPGPEQGHVGYAVDEMADNVERNLRELGLTSRFAPLVIFTGHGSSSLNNPHESAYNCGACSGGRGGPNARAFAQMANDPRVRAILSARGLTLPTNTHFLGVFHNTCNDRVEYFDLDRMPATHVELFEATRRSIDEARRRNAHERCRRFESAELSITPAAALAHVEQRAEDLSQARPEYNHATNAVTFIGRRSRIRGLFMDRRAFLSSYDPEQDDENFSILARVLAPAVPVCAGISLEYYFSTVDVQGYGSGSKLPHNIVSLLGVMEGAASDLRPGLSAQMVEIHEPLRCLFVVETTPAAMEQLIAANPTINRLCQNEWIQVATLDPHGPILHLRQNGRFVRYWPETDELPEVESSIDWYRGWRDHLGYAVIKTPTGEEAAR